MFHSIEEQRPYEVLHTLRLAIFESSFGAHGQISQISQSAGESSENSQDPLTEERLQQLISTLENESARTEFIANLKTLSAAEQDQEDAGPKSQVSTLLNLDETSNSLLKAFADTLNSLGLDDSRLDQFLLFGSVSLGILVVLLFNSWLSRFLDKKLNPMRSRLHLDPSRLSPFFALQRWFGYLFASLLLLYAVKEVYAPWPSLLNGVLDPATLSRYSLVFMVICITFVAVWESVNALMEYGSYASPRLRRSRMQTLLPIVRNVLLFVLLVMAGLVIMSELSIEIMPLLAGAGIFGIALGFGAQAVVRDFLNGFIVIFEDLLQVGDIVRVGGRVGQVEKITIRKIQLRDLSGAVHTVPFSEVSIVENLTKEFSYYLMDIGVSYRENVDEVIECIKEVLETMRAEDDFKHKILESLEVMGVDEFADSAVMIRARIKTPPGGQWEIGREFNRRMKHAFDEHNIEIPFPHQTVYFGEDKKGRAPKAQVRLFDADAKESVEAEEPIEAENVVEAEKRSGGEVETATSSKARQYADEPS